MAKRSYDGKTVIVTGAARGLGAALCRRFAAAGARIGGVDLLTEELDATRDAVRSAGATMAAASGVDLGDEAATVAAIERLRGELGSVDVLIANAGITRVHEFGAEEAAAIRRVMEVNFQGAVHATAACFDDLVARRGQIVVISSVAGFAPLALRSGYSASKHALHGFFETLRAELRDDGVGVLLVCPSFLATAIGDTAGSGSRQRRPLGGEAAPEEVAERVFRAAAAGRRHLVTGLVGKASYWVRRLAPWLYELVMRRTMGGKR
jgi:short-subunit dehydrogenase